MWVAMACAMARRKVYWTTCSPCHFEPRAFPPERLNIQLPCIRHSPTQEIYSHETLPCGPSRPKMRLICLSLGLVDATSAGFPSQPCAPHQYVDKLSRDEPSHIPQSISVGPRTGIYLSIA